MTMRRFVLVLVMAGTAWGQKTPDGHPDFSGMYDVGTLTPLERGAGTKLVMTKAEALAREKAVAAEKAAGDVELKGERKAPPKGGDGSAGAAGNVGGYNTFWLDTGDAYTVVRGEKRGSIVVEPAEGRVPPLNSAARQRLAAQRAAAPTSDAGESKDPGLEPAGAYDDPERRPLGERCLLSFASSSGPPALPTYFYNNLHQIVQTKDTVTIVTEMVHDARIVRMNAQHLPKSIRNWMGDSVGRWEGETLVIDTTNFTDKTRFRNSTENLHVVERISRLNAKTLLYRFTVDDAATWDKPWTGEYAWPQTQEKMYEYACHEANYSMTDILRGARLREAEQAAAKGK
jgi:hypothetical protein